MADLCDICVEALDRRHWKSAGTKFVFLYHAPEESVANINAKMRPKVRHPTLEQRDHRGPIQSTLVHAKC